MGFKFSKEDFLRHYLSTNRSLQTLNMLKPYIFVGGALRHVIKEYITHVVTTCQNNMLLPWCVILNHMPYYDMQLV